MPVPVIPKLETCVLFNSDDTMFDLVLFARSYQQRTKMWWTSCPDGLADVGGGVIVLRNSLGTPTWIPSYDVYSSTWEGCGLVNPFEYNWLDHDKCCPVASRYLENVISILDDQVVIWESDLDSSHSLVFICFDEFIRCLKRLYAYECGFNNYGRLSETLLLSQLSGLKKLK